MARRRLQGLNPAERPTRAPGVAPPRGPRRRVGPMAGGSDRGEPAPAGAEDGAARPARATAGGPRAKAGKVMHSVPGEVLERLKQAAHASGKSYTDLALECVLAERANPAAANLGAAGGADPLARRVAAARGGRRARAAQLTLYLTGEERAALDALAGALGMARSQLVATALDRHLQVS